MCRLIVASHSLWTTNCPLKECRCKKRKWGGTSVGQMVKWTCLVKVKDRVRSKELRQRLRLDDIILVQRNRLQWHGHLLQKEDNDWVKNCMEYEVEGARPRGRPKKTWRERVEKDCQVRRLNRKDAMYRIRWMKQIRDDWWPRWVWVGECFFWCWLTRVVPDKIHRAVKQLCVWGGQPCLNQKLFLLAHVCWSYFKT